ncbi:MAG TPA: endonuclease Q family protein, partial [Patescibacteria group bacterium]|nr:endonuclease Q family protein [Patescibacteria group bacterium]
MQIIADLQLHSKYSRAVSKDMVIPIMSEWGEKKGTNLLATGDWTHPLWFKELETNLEEAGKGIYKLKNSDKKTRFLLSGEISSIYTANGKGRRVHTLFFAPSLEVVRKINEELTKRGANLLSDGRPIVGLSCQELCEVVWGVDESVLVIPAHAWTPWFALYGSKSGFDSVKECFGQYEQRIYAIETGLSSDPMMNWQIADLDKRAIVSFSDAHSPKKLAREATVLTGEIDTEITFADVSSAISERFTGKPGRLKIAYTIEFYPEEGKYHYTGHRTCGVVQTPEETRKKGTICHVCGRPLTVGVMHRVEQLGHLPELTAIKKTNDVGLTGYYHPTDKTRPPYVMLVPLHEIIAESLEVGVASKRVDELYQRLIAEFG